MRALVLALAVLLPGCATHHIGDCMTCAGYVHVQGQAADAVQTKTIYTAVTTGLQNERKVMQQTVASVAQVRSTS